MNPVPILELLEALFHCALTVLRVLAFWFSTGGADLSFSIFPRILSIRCLSTSTGAGEWSQSKQYTSNYRNLLCLTASSPRLSPFPCSRKRDILPRASELCRRLVSLPVDLCRSESERRIGCRKNIITAAMTPTPPSTTGSSNASRSPEPQFRVVRKRNRIPLSCYPCRTRKL
ncbi:hypothetical protein VTJ04DRAFT_3085 [Mycothermus thermophilus]|uniref:uncharacterized protein n=1 Tax=Humicola insolens TaxID=85995 RepID=UPI00374232D4